MQNDKHTTKKVRQLLKEAYQTLEFRNKIAPFFFTAAVGLIWSIVFILLEAWFYLDPALKLTLSAGIAVFTFFVFFRLKRILLKHDFVSFYRGFANTSDLPELAYAVDLDSSSALGNPKLIEAAIIQNLSSIPAKKLRKSLDRFIRNNKISRVFKKSTFLVLIASASMIFIAFSLPDATYRTAQFWKTFERPNPYQFIVTPGDQIIEQGTAVTPSVSFTGTTPEQITLKLKTDIENDYRDFKLSAVDDYTYRAEPLELSSNTRYFIQMDDYKSRIYNIDVQLRPRLEELSAVVAPPSYTGLDSTVIGYPFSQIRAYQGSKLRLKGKLNKELRTFNMIKDSVIANNLNELLTERTRFSGSVNVNKPDTIWFEMEDVSGLKNSNPFRFIIQPVNDEYPFVEITQPETSIEKVDIKTVPITYRASDDFAITKLELHYEVIKAYVNTPVRRKILLDIPTSGRLSSYQWDVRELDLKPRDEVNFWLEATDNDRYNGAKTTRSSTLSIRIPSLVDYFEELDEKETEVEKTLDDVAESFEQMEAEYEEFKQELKENPQKGWEQKNDVEQVKRKQEEVQKNIEELNKKFEEIKKELDQNNLLSEETLKAYEELEKLQKELDDPAFLEALEELKKSLESLSPQEMQKALEETEFNEQAYKERIERTIELFKKLKLTSDLEKIAKSAEDLAEQQNESSGQESEDKEKEKKQEILDQSERLKKQLNRLMEYVSPKTRKPVEDFSNEAEQELNEAQKKLQKLLEQLNKEQQDGKSSEQISPQQKQENQQIRQHFNQIAQKARETQKGLNRQQAQVNVSGLTYTLYSLIHLSDAQEELTENAQRTENRSQAYIEYAREQKNIEKIFSAIADSLYKLSKDIPQLPNQINKKRLKVEENIEQALNQITERDQSRASIATRQALGGINELAFMVADLLEQLQNSQNGGQGQGGNASMEQLLEQLRDAAGQQKQLNQQLQELINDIQGDRLSQDQQQRLEQLSKQQNRIRKQLEELRRNGALEEGDRLNSELQRMIEEMEESINDIRGGATDPLLKKRQQNILSRMLQAEKALQERDKEEKREGKTADPVAPRVSPDVTLEELEKEIRSRLQDPDFTKYSPDYQRLIEKYFELLKQLRGEENEIQQPG